MLILYAAIIWLYMEGSKLYKDSNKLKKKKRNMDEEQKKNSKADLIKVYLHLSSYLFSSSVP